MSILDNALLVGKETTYGQPAPLSRGYEAHADGWKFDQAQIDSVGFRAGIQALRKDRTRAVAMGGEGTIEVDFLNQSLGLLLDCAFGTTTGPTTVQTTGKQYVFSTSAAEPASSLTVQMQRAKVDGGVDVYQFNGAVAKMFSLQQSVGELLKATVEFDAAQVDMTATAGAPQYVDGAIPYDWVEGAVTVAGASIDSTDFSFQIDHKLNTERRYLRGSFLKRRPRRGGLPEISGSLTAAYVDNSLQTIWTAGTIVPITFTVTGGIIGAGPAVFSVSLTLPACQFTGDSPEASMSALTQQQMAFRVLDPGAGVPAATLTVVTSDTAL